MIYYAVSGRNWYPARHCRIWPVSPVEVPVVRGVRGGQHPRDAGNLVKRYYVAAVKDFPPGSRRILDADGRSIGVFNIRGEFFALRNSCPHQGAPLCLGRISGTTLPTKPFVYEYGRDDEIIKCPWHGWEFDIATGRSVFNPHKTRVKTYAVTVEAREDEDPRIETFTVTVEDDVVVLHA